VTAKRIAVVLDVIIIGFVVVAITYVVQSAGRAIIDPAFRSHVLEPQERSCVIRNDVCKLVDWLRSNAATTFDIGPGLTPEVTQRLVELAFPIRVMRDAPIRVDFCHLGRPAEQPRLRLADVKRASDSNADLCVFDRR
jgi:hypothetical protein